MALRTPKTPRPPVRLPPGQRWITVLVILALAALAVVWGVTRGADLGTETPRYPAHRTELPHLGPPGR